MNFDLQIKLQAYLDNELPAGEAKSMAALLTRDQEAASLLQELKAIKTALAGNELAVALPESREFYWSKIEREIERQERAPRTAPLQPWWRKLFVPVSMAAIVALLATYAVVQLPQHSKDATLGAALARLPAPSEMRVLEVGTDEMGANTFRSQSEGLTVVWLYNRGDETPAAVAPAPEEVEAKAVVGDDEEQ